MTNQAAPSEQNQTVAEWIARRTSRRSILGKALSGVFAIGASALLGVTLSTTQSKASYPCDFPWGNCAAQDCWGQYCTNHCSFSTSYHNPYACWWDSGVECCDCACGDQGFVWACGCQGSL
jgi:hypothetical protein